MSVYFSNTSFKLLVNLRKIFKYNMIEHRLVQAIIVLNALGVVVTLPALFLLHCRRLTPMVRAATMDLAYQQVIFLLSTGGVEFWCGGGQY